MDGLFESASSSQFSSSVQFKSRVSADSIQPNFVRLFSLDFLEVEWDMMTINGKMGE